MLGTVDAIDYDGDRLHKVVLRFPAVRSGESEIVKEVWPCERIGQGSFGTVYRAVSSDYPRLALKISTGKSTRLRQELDVLSRVCTKGRLLLPRFEFGALNKTADLIVIGMELCVPSTLHDLLLSTRITSEAEMLFMAHQAVQAVSYVHAEGCIHRDIKLQNFVFDLDGNLKLIDFGLACNSLKPPAGDVVAGTVSFMSPEMAHNALHKDRRVSVGVAADVWSLGIVLFSIFTQRNPYPAPETPAPAAGSAPGGAGAAGVTGRGDITHGAEGEKGNDLSQQHRMNERLLRRVAAGDWQWPVGVTVSQDLKQLVNSILVVNPEERPSVSTILENKLWNLRRRYPPAAVAAFLGVQDDFLLSHDEAHLMRAVEERSAGVAASLRNSRLHSPASASNEDNGETDAQHSSSGSARNGGLNTSGATTSPARSSLKVVQRCGEGGIDGAVTVQVYDVRASTRKRSKPIREISVVMAEETAKTRRSKSARRATGAVSAPSSRVVSRAASTEYSRRIAPPAGARLQSSAAHTCANSGDDEGEAEAEAEAVNRGTSTSQRHSRGMSPVRLQDALETAGSVAAGQRDSVGHPKALVEPSCATPPLLTSGKQQPLSEHMRPDIQRSGSVELLEDAEAPTEASAMPTSHKRAASSGKKRRDASLRQPSSLILKGSTRDLSADAPRSTTTAASTQASTSLLASRTTLPLSAVNPSPSSSRQASLRRQASASVAAVSSAQGCAGHRGSSPVMKRAQRVALELGLDVIWHDEADHRRALSAMLLIEHAWLLASFRLTIEEDQERYSITWLAEEQEKSAAHPHRFKEVMQVMSKKYQYGFVCDMCDYEFLPTGPGEKDLHFFHCPCGRDLCPDCYTAYQRQCTCSCCRAVHSNSCVLREHLLLTGGTQYYSGSRKTNAAARADAVRGSFQAAASLNEEAESGDEASAAPEPPRRRGRPPKQDKNRSAVKQKGSRAAKDSSRRRRGAQDTLDVSVDDAHELEQINLPRISIAAMQQQEERSSNGSHRGGGTAAVGVAPRPQRPEDVEVKQRPVESVPEGPWRPFARFKKDRRDEVAQQPTPEERDALLNGEWIRHFYLFPQAEPERVAASGTWAEGEEEPYAFVYHAQPGRTGAIFLTSDFPMHSAVFSMLERQFFVVNQVDTVEGVDSTRATSLLKAKGHPELRIAFHALQDIVAYDTNMMKQQRTPGTVSVYQAPRSAYSCNGEPFLYVRWFRFNENRTLSAFLLSNGAVQVFVNNEYELRWFDESRKFLIRYNGVCELVDDGTFALAPGINHLLYDSFDA
ncbi:kinetoplastid kinetochore protein 3 / KKT3 [Leishmania donovani]|uniref:Kinetoplastid_kinetochore_protein_3_putative/Gene DB:LmjF.35.4050 n=1 Tax=Leishmania donovani TaxID=5661 RepID=A0A6J8FMU8_LEIDO|nr:kinetoplastid kinetochore protein 3 / KKT3 [Leishmania donovani]VDZ49049.1 kinetoplastid_kinetochore_protein_3_putative/GeneDB:LmjF.35.4050 [Leishmania donovani]